MQFTPKLFPDLIQAISETIEQNAEEVTELDKVCGDGDHVTNLQRGLAGLSQQSDEIATLEWAQALQKIGMTLLSTMGGASGSLFGTLFLSMSKAVGDKVQLNQQDFAGIFMQGVDAVKKRGKSDAGEKTMLDVLIPVADFMIYEKDDALESSDLFEKICQTAIKGMESTREMMATKGRASYLGEKTIGHIDAGARTSQLMICAVVDVLKEQAQG
jgi:dihydroxyacetone kinase-like protein